MAKKQGERGGFDEYVCMEAGRSHFEIMSLMRFRRTWSPIPHTFYRWISVCLRYIEYKILTKEKETNDRVNPPSKGDFFCLGTVQYDTVQYSILRFLDCCSLPFLSFSKPRIERYVLPQDCIFHGLLIDQDLWYKWVNYLKKKKKTPPLPPRNYSVPSYSDVTTWPRLIHA